jgi:pyruvate dehydrogenase E2 component (dihydrolipoamide acetyltransferase)
MAYILVMPKQGNSVESCVITSIKAAEGAEVKADTVLFEVETDKAVMEVPAGADGTVLKILVKEGDDVPVMQAIAVIGVAGEDWAALLPTENLTPDNADYADKKVEASQPPSALSASSGVILSNPGSCAESQAPRQAPRP